MAKLEKIVHVALDELRMQMLGTQVLFGFQFQGVFQETFAQTPVAVRTVDAIALSLLVLTLVLLVAAPSQHRLVEHGEATTRIFHVANRFAEIALAPFAIVIGCDLYVVAEQYWGETLAASAGIAASAIALLLLYGLGAALKTVVPRKQQEIPLPAETKTDLHEKIDQMLTETRVILPGAQALLGFQFVVTMTKAFAALPMLDRDIHFVALSAVALAVMLLLTPAAVHRVTFGGQDAPRFHDIGSALVTIALAPLAVGISADFYVAVSKMLGKPALAAAGAVVAALLLASFWYAIPLLLRSSRRTKKVAD
jgi:hypothetical protein